MKEWPSFSISVFTFQHSFNKKQEWSSAVDGAIVSAASRSALDEVYD